MTIRTFGDFEVHPSDETASSYSVVHNGRVRNDALTESEAVGLAEELSQEEERS